MLGCVTLEMQEIPGVECTPHKQLELAQHLGVKFCLELWRGTALLVAISFTYLVVTL